MAEAGVDGVVGFYWNGVLAPAGTPPPVIDKLNAVINEGLRSREVHANLVRLGMQPKIGSVQDFAALIAAEYQRWEAIARAANFCREWRSFNGRRPFTKAWRAGCRRSCH